MRLAAAGAAGALLCSAEVRGASLQQRCAAAVRARWGGPPPRPQPPPPEAAGSTLEAALTGSRPPDVYLKTEDVEDQRFFARMRANSVVGGDLPHGPASEHMCPMPEWAWSNATGILMDHQCYDTTWREAFLGMASALEKSLVEEWWPAEGTLVALMRYGKGSARLSRSSDVAAGGDIEFMVNADPWTKNSTSSCLQSAWNSGCHRSPGDAWSRQWSSPICSGWPRTTTRLTSRSITSSAPTSRSATQHMWCRSSSTATRWTLDEGRPSSRRFAALSGGADGQAASARGTGCRTAYGRSVPCPREALKILERSGEYPGCMGLPLVQWVRVGVDARNRDLALNGLTLEDLELLEANARRLHQAGHLSFLRQFASGGCARRQMEQLRASTAPRALRACANCTEVLCLHIWCKIDWGVDPVLQFLATARAVISRFVVTLAHGVVLARGYNPKGMKALKDHFQTELSLQKWQMAVGVPDRLLGWALEALSFREPTRPPNADEALGTKGFQLLWRHHPSLAADVYLLLRLRGCTPGLPPGRLAARLSRSTQAARNAQRERLLLGLPRWLRRSLQNRRGEGRDGLRLLRILDLGNCSGSLLLSAAATACQGARRSAPAG
ncbi:unnamed protein product, partial [Symbiodinium natans]